MLDWQLEGWWQQLCDRLTELVSVSLKEHYEDLCLAFGREGCFDRLTQLIEDIVGVYFFVFGREYCWQKYRVELTGPNFFPFIWCWQNLICFHWWLDHSIFGNSFDPWDMTGTRIYVMMRVAFCVANGIVKGATAHAVGGGGGEEGRCST